MISGFAPIADPRANILILGSMPGQASLEAHQYYAHPRNAFWPIMGALLNFDPMLNYARRCTALQDHKIAVWDVLAACRRQGSLDAAIERRSAQANDFATFFNLHPHITHLFFNGRKAESLFHQQVMATVDADRKLDRVSLPSTSPAHAAMSLGQKLEKWQAVGDALAEIN